MMQRSRTGPFITLATAAAMTLLVAMPLVAGDRHTTSDPSDTIAVGVPLEIDISADESTMFRGQITHVQVTVRALADLEQVAVRTTTRGKMELETPTDLDRAFLAEGDALSFSVPARLLDVGKSGLLVDASATLAGKRFSFSQQGELNVLLRDDRAFAGPEHMMYLENRALQLDRAAGRLTSEQVASSVRALAVADTVPAGTGTPAPPSPRSGASLSVEPERTEIGRESEAEDALVAGPIMPAADNINVFGTVRYLDENGTAHPVFGYDVQVRDDDLIGSDLLASAATSTDGTYNFVVSSDDPGGPDIFVRFRSRNTLIIVRPMGFLFTHYENDECHMDDVGSNAVIQCDITFANTGNGPEASVLSGMTWIAVYVRDLLNGGTPLGQLPVEYPGTTGAAFYNGSMINMRPNDGFDWDVMHHEFGHYVMDSFNFENNPGGPHNIGQCLAVTRPSKSEGLRLAWGEAWPTFFGTTGQMRLGLGFTEAPRVGDAVYADTISGFGGFSYGLDSNSNDLVFSPDANGLGEDNEVAIQRALYDVWDNVSDSRDVVSRNDLDMFNVLRNSGATTYSAAWGLVRASGLISGNADDLDFGAITTDHRVGPQPLSPTAATIVTSANSTFSWNADVGCSNTFAGDGFSLEFYDANTFASIMTVPGLAATSTVLSQAQILNLTSVTHDVIWAVEGSNSASPATGPYLGDNIQIVVNTPPVADAGPDQPNVECASYTTTPVLLDGTGSSDADGDPLDYLWTAPGVVFDDPTSVTPIGEYPKGSTLTTLQVDDGIQQDTDTVNITVVDTTKPEITCPDDIVVECSEFNGAPITHPEIQAFLAAAMATDICDPNPVITDNAPGFFNLGDTVVTFTATDVDGNFDECDAIVTVQDTTPPVIEMSLDRTVLWPPNHRLIEITASVMVTDICDPAPTFVLTSITSNEPDNGTGIGDGNTDDDIQMADIGTPDVMFKLRAERAGIGAGRLYEVTYTGMDMSGNTADASEVVTVPHNQSGVTEPIMTTVAKTWRGHAFAWQPVEGAFYYNIVRGHLESVTETDGVIDLGGLRCIESRSIDASTVGYEDTEVPEPGKAFFYMVEYNDGWKSEYGTESAAKPRAPAWGGCR